jgi:hypothetical protein
MGWRNIPSHSLICRASLQLLFGCLANQQFGCAATGIGSKDSRADYLGQLPFFEELDMLWQSKQ